MDTKTAQMDFKILVDQTLASLDKFDAVSRCDALHYLLRNLKFKYPQACEQVIPSIFPQISLVDNKKPLLKYCGQYLLPIKKEECIKNEDENASTDLNQNFEKILCKEEFMCLDEDDNAYADENSSSQSKRVRYTATNAARGGAGGGGALRLTTGCASLVQQQADGDPLDLIPSSVIHARRLGRIATAVPEAEESNSLDALGPEISSKRSRRRGFGGLNPPLRSNIGKINLQTSRFYLGDKLQRVYRLGEGYIFHPDSEFTVHFHHSSQDLSTRVFKEQFRLHLKTALKLHDKEFLKEFQREFVFSGRLLGTTPPKHVLDQLRLEHLEEWKQQKLRELQQQQLLLQQYQQQRHQMMLMQQRRRILAGSMGNAYDSEMEFELETESQLSSASQEIMKFEEIIDEGVGPGRLIDGLVMEPEMDDVIGGGSGASVSGGSSNSSGGNGLDTLPNDSASTFVGGNTTVPVGGSTFKNHLAQQQPQHGPNNAMMMNGLTPSLANNVIANNIGQQQTNSQQQLQALAQSNNSPANIAQKEHLQHSQHQLHYQPQIISNQQLQQPHNHKAGLMNDKQPQGHHVNNLMNNMGQPPGQQQQPHFQNQSQQQQQQRFMMQHQQQQNHFNSNMQPQNHPLAMIGGMMETANQQHQQQMQVQRMQLNASNNMINSIDNILAGGTASANKSTPPPAHINSENMPYGQQHQQFPPHLQNLPLQQQQHMLMQQQQNLLSGSNLTSTNTLANSVATPATNSSANASFEHDDEGISHDEDEEDHENDTNDGMEPKQQLIDGGSSSSTSLQAPSAAGNASTPGTKKEKPSYSCLLCPKSYRKRKSLLDHYKIHPGYCHDCGKPNGTSLEEIIHHNRTVHVKEFPFVCETCGESYSRRQQFHAHVESHNKKEFKNIVSVSLAYSCIECGQKFPHKKLHQQHLEDTGHKADGAICEVCGDEFPSKNALYQHIIRVHKKDNFFECHICQNRFTLKANLERHVQLHTEIKRTYVCDTCGSSYFTYPALKDHYSNAHTDASECKCTLCGKRFGSVKSLQRHLPSHSEERPHCCCYCEQTFKWKTHLVRHKQTVHGNQPSPKKVKRFAKEGDELVPMTDEPGPPPAKVAKKSNASKPKQQANQQPQQIQQQQQQQQQKMGAIATPPPLSTTPGTSSSSQQDPFNAAIISNNSSQSSTASTSQHSMQSSESQPNSMYSQNFSAEKLLGQHSQQQPQPQQILTGQPQSHTLSQQQQQLQQQRPTPPPHAHAQQQQQQPPTPQQTQPHHRHTPNSHTPDNNLPRINSFGGGGPSQPETQFHFEPSAAGGQQPSNITNPGAYPQHQIINQYQQQHHLQQQAAQQQQQHMRSHTPQSPHHHVQHQQHFPLPHQQHLQNTPQHQQQLHHHQQMMHQQQLQHQQQQQQQQQQQPPPQPHQRQHNQQRSPHPHQTPAQQIQQQHQQPMHSPQHVRLQSPAPQAHTPQPLTPQPQQQQTPTPQQQQQQSQQQPSVAANHQQQYTTDPWGNINFVGHPSNASTHPQQQQQQNNTTNIPGEKENPNKYYIVDSSEFLGLPMNVAGGNTPGVTETNNQVTNPQQQQQQHQQQQSPMVASKPPQQQEQNIGGDLMSFQNMWPQGNQGNNQLSYSANGAQQQQQPSTQQQTASQQTTAAVSSVAATDPHNYNNIGSILTNLIDNNPNPMEYNFEIMQQQQQGSGGSGTSTPVGAQQAQQPSQQTSLGVQHHQQQQQQQQQHQQPTASAAAYGLQPTPGASGLIRHVGVYGAPTSLYEPHHHPAHHPTSLAEMTEQQKNSFQPYHPHAGLQPHAHALGGHPLAPTAHHPLAAASHLLPPPPPHAGHHVYDRGGYPVLGGGIDEGKAVLPPISDYMHHMQQQHVQQPDLLYYPVKND